jgi:hypothetical protein
VDAAELAARDAGHDRTNPSGIPDEGLDHEHEGKTHQLRKEPQPIPEQHSEEGHDPGS